MNNGQGKEDKEDNPTEEEEEMDVILLFYNSRLIIN
jgi:hypothetical protein